MPARPYKQLKERKLYKKPMPRSAQKEKMWLKTNKTNDQSLPILDEEDAFYSNDKIEKLV